MTEVCDLCCEREAYGVTECGSIHFCDKCADDSDQLEQEHSGNEVFYYLAD